LTYVRSSASDPVERRKGSGFLGAGREIRRPVAEAKNTFRNAAFISASSFWKLAENDDRSGVDTPAPRYGFMAREPTRALATPEALTPAS
jgi:hypothetical protein